MDSRLNRMLATAGGMGGGAAPGSDNTSLIDNSETVYISSLALLKMLRHGRAGVPMEVMGLMLGEFVDDFTVRVVDVFAMPQSGTGVSVEAVDPVFQTKMMDMLRQTGRPETVTALEENMLMNLHKHVWTEGLQMDDFRVEGKKNNDRLQRLVGLSEGYEKRVKEETELTKDQLKTRYVGKQDPKKHLEDVGQQLIEDNIVSVSRQMIDKEASGPAKEKKTANGEKMETDEDL
ncbi:26S proteasome regulatory subunit N11 [Pseudogymnoascus sp. 24MN13]|nr:26S proteasome regulatory subunit N11 [Pseudogymnoascus sp. 24MN13]